MKKVISFMLVVTMALSLVTFASAATEYDAVSVAEEETVLELEYMEFYENQDYYMDLVETKGYTLHFYVDEEHRDLEMARQAEDVNCVDEMSSVMTRGTTVPTKEHNILNGALSFEGKADYSDLYTNYYCTGSSWYTVTVNNYIYSNRMLTVRAYNVLSGQETTTFPSGTTIKKYTMKGSGATAPRNHFYLRFDAPVNVSGTIARAR